MSTYTTADKIAFSERLDRPARAVSAATGAPWPILAHAARGSESEECIVGEKGKEQREDRAEYGCWAEAESPAYRS